MLRSKKIWLIVILLIIPILVCAQTRPNRPGQGVELKQELQTRMYDSTTVATYTGVIKEVIKKESKRGAQIGVHLIIETKEELLDVHVGPNWYLDQLRFGFEEESMIVVTGSRITYEGKPAVIAKSIDFKGREYKLRADDGRPAWAGYRRPTG